MKKCTAIICEYNPFHNGHLYQINEVKKHTDLIMCIMSGNTVQRGGFSIWDKYTRAKIAIDMGANLVIEHPFPYSMSTAADFAFSGTYIANAFCADSLAFGHESSKESIEEIAKVLCDENTNVEIKNIMEKEKNLSFPKAREIFIERVLGEKFSKILRMPNNILSLEYLKNLKKYSRISPYFITRKSTFLSATQIREKIINSENIAENVPYIHDNNFVSSSCDISILSHLILQREYKDVYDCDSSLYYRIVSNAGKSKNIDELISKCVTSAYTASKIRRSIYSIFFGTTGLQVKTPPLFSILLGADKKGLDFLSQNKKKFLIPLFTRQSECKKYNINSESVFIADRLYCLFNNSQFSPFLKPYISNR